MIKNYQKKPVVIQAVQWTTSNIAEVEAFMGVESLKGLDMESTTAYDAGVAPPCASFLIETLEGDMRAMHGDYIIKGLKGEFYPCKPDIFNDSYIAVDDE